LCLPLQSRLSPAQGLSDAGHGLMIEALLGFRFLPKASVSKLRLWGIWASALILIAHWLITLMN
jgi:hypothetical protein